MIMYNSTLHINKNAYKYNKTRIKSLNSPKKLYRDANIKLYYTLKRHYNIIKLTYKI